MIFTKGIPRGIEFAGGTVVISRFDQEPSVQQVRAALDQTFGGQNVVVQTYGDPSQRQIMVRVPGSRRRVGHLAEQRRREGASRRCGPPTSAT